MERPRKPFNPDLQDFHDYLEKLVDYCDYLETEYGFSQGYEEGYQIGHDEGFDDGIDEGYSQGYKDCKEGKESKDQWPQYSSHKKETFAIES